MNEMIVRHINGLEVIIKYNELPTEQDLEEIITSIKRLPTKNYD